MFFSIITVTYNCENTIKKTLDSLAIQDFNDYELILVDGKSNDRTLRIIKSSSLFFKNITILSEHDKGIYDAMNKGILKSKGQYLYFLNSGDSFIDSKVLSNVYNLILSNKGFHVYFGNIIYQKENRNITHIESRKVSLLNFSFDRFVHHQSIFALKDTFIDNLFDLQYKISADHNWIAKSFMKGFKFYYLKISISIFDREGISSRSRNQIMKEHENILIRISSFYYFINLIKHILSRFIKR